MKIFRSKLFLRSSALIFALFSVLFGYFFVYKAEIRKREEKFNELSVAYEDFYSDWKTYREDYLYQIEQIRKDNQKAMEDAKSEYEEMLSKQDQIIREHTRLVADPNQPAGNYSASSGGTTTVKKIVQVAKPSSAPKTSAS